MRAFLRKSGILVWVIAAIILATVLGSVRIGGDHLVPVEIGRIFATFSAIFSQFLSFLLSPLIIIGPRDPRYRGPGPRRGQVAGHHDGDRLRVDALLGLPHLPGVRQRSSRASSPTTQLGDVAEPGSALESYFTIEMPAPCRL